MSDTSITKELALTVKHFDFDLNDIGNIIINGFKSSFMSYADKKKILHDVLIELNGFGYDSDYLKNSTQIT